MKEKKPNNPARQTETTPDITALEEQIDTLVIKNITEPAHAHTLQRAGRHCNSHIIIKRNVFDL